MPQITFRKILPGFIWLLLVIILLSLPSSTLPSATWMSKIQIDKWVHIFLFSMLTIFFCFPLLYAKQKPSIKYFTKYLIIATLTSIAIGIIMEYIQKYIPGRSFDIWDIVADSIGAIVGAIFCSLRYKKSPDRHQGRN